jgi:hypothetical protein
VSRAAAEIHLAADTSKIVQQLEDMRFQLHVNRIMRSISIALHVGYTVERIVIGHRLLRTLSRNDPAGPHYGKPESFLGYPVEVDESVELGYGLVVRSPATVR